MSERHLKCGEECAIGVLESGRDYLGVLTEEERVEWFAGFLSAFMGFAGSYIGTHAAVLLRDSIGPIAHQVISDRVQ